MSNCIIYTTAGAGVNVIIPAPDCGLSLEQIAAKDVPAGTPFYIINAADLPADRTFRDAWEHQGGAVVESIGKARLIAHERRRAKRADEFAPLDIEATIPAKAAQAEAARQVIRTKYDVMQSAMDAAQTVAELRALLP